VQLVADEEQKPKDYEAPKGAETKGSWNGGKKPLGYTATAKFYVLRKNEKPSAELFSVSYVADGGDSSRPVSFIFNGGPGASSAYLHMGALGPSRVDFPADGTLPALPPKLVENESSWLAFTDLVFVDPVGTGFSRIVENDEKKDEQKSGEAKKPEDEYFGPKRDLESLCEFMTRWLSENDRWGSPIFIAGESYGGYRVGRLVKMLQEDAGIGLNGAVLISPALELGGLDLNDYGVVQWVDVLPTMAGAAAHHGRGRALPATASLDEVRAAAEEFAAGDYAKFLVLGASLDAAERARILSRLADFLGLPVEFVTRAEGRIGLAVFARELLRDERKVVGLYDATITTTDPFPDRTGHEAPDATLAGIAAAYTAAINKQLRSEIGVETDRDYRLLSFEVNQAWKEDSKKHFFEPPDSATDSFRYGLALNPHMQAFITHGRFDMVTPYYTTDRLCNLMRLDPAMAARLTVQHFGGGHMFYAWEDSRHAFTAAISQFYESALV
jgi:carboxypeptidase C (cathepsin A)